MKNESFDFQLGTLQNAWVDEGASGPLADVQRA